MRCLNKKEIVIRNRYPLESIEVTQRNTATHPPNYLIKDQQRQTTANSANLNYDPTYRLRSFQPDQPRTLPMAVTTHPIFPRYTVINNLVQYIQFVS